MPHSTDPSRDLLFGLLALQTGMIDQGALFTAFAAWTRDKARSLADHLVELGHLDSPRRAAVEAIAGVHVQALGGDIEKSLAVLAVRRSTHESLVRAGGPEVEATLGHVASAHGLTHDDEDPERTASHAVGTATSDGQRFCILRPHARGGLGAVFVALDSELHREVALKQILEKHADDPVSRLRFLAEAEITGGLEHPGVVPVYGLGTDSCGRPYYAMRFIKGDSLKEAIARFHEDEALKGDPGRRSLELRKLLRRFTDVCNAIDYAHSRGVIHRDLKPANIIVGKHGETLVVDWGLAKAVGRADPSVGEQTLAPSSGGSSETLPGSALGTPAYMSPEQARGELERLGPRSDVYSLGATLYCLLTAKPAFEGDDIGAILHCVQEGRFQRPSQSDPSLDKALESVCLKAMATQPDDRYPTPRALADDLDRWMADEPVTAWREPFSRRTRRWARRNRIAMTAAAVAVVAGVVGLAAVLAVQTRANTALAVSLQRETTAKTALADTNADLTRSRAAVEARYDLAVEAIKTFHTGVSEDFLLKQEQFKEVRDRLLKSASDFYGRLGALLGKESDLASRRALWRANYEVADLTGKVGKPEDALAAHRQVLAARESLAAEIPADPEIKADVGRSLTAVAGLLGSTGQAKEAEATFRKAETLLVELAPTIAEAGAARAVLANCRSRLGGLLETMGRFNEAMSAYRLARADQEALAAVPGATVESRQELAATIHGNADLLRMTGKSLEAEAEYRKALSIEQKLADGNPTITEFRGSLAHSHNNLGNLLSNTGKSSAAEAEYRKAAALWQKLADDNPAVTQFRLSLAGIHNNLGNLLISNPGTLSEADAELSEALAIQQKLADEYPAVTRFRSFLAATHTNRGNLRSRTGKSSEAEAEHRKALAIRQKLADDNPAVTVFRTTLASNHNDLGWLLSNTGQSSAAEAEYRKALAINEKLADDYPAILVLHRGLADTLLYIGWQLALAGKTDEAIDCYTREEAIRQKLAQPSSAAPTDRNSLANCQTNTADALRRSGRLEKALATCERALAVREALVAANPDVPWYRPNLGETYLRLGQVRFDMKNVEGAADAWKRACTLIEANKSVYGEDRWLLACCHACLAGLAGRPGSGRSAAHWTDQAERAMDLLRQAVTLGYRNPDLYRTESGLDPLRNRPDFRLLMMDVAFPTKPFTQ
jgi:tetratricopeptide (TPR) repeat protein/tRNA A-37 threonylcarbamoyl transferase component Bud32